MADDTPRAERRKGGRPFGSARRPEQKNTCVIEVYVTPAMALELRNAAYEDGMALSVVTRRLYREYLDSRKKPT